MKYTLSREYLNIASDSLSYGGNQRWFGGMMGRCGCGIISAADTLWYLRRGKNHPKQASYEAYIRGVKKHFLMLPYKGMPGISMAFFLNLYLRHLNLPFKARWGVLPQRISAAAADVIRHDIPVPFCVGPCLLRFFRKDHSGLKLYNEAGIPAASVTNHFMVMTEIDGDMAKVSSWGNTFYIRLSELETFARFDFFGLMTNLVYIRRKDVSGK